MNVRVARGALPSPRAGAMLGYPHTPWDGISWVGTARTRALLCQPCLCSRWCEIYQLLPTALLPPCLPPTPNPIRNLLLGTAPACAEGSLTQRLPADSQETGREAKPTVCLSPALAVLPGSWGYCPCQEQLQEGWGGSCHAHPQNPQALVLQAVFQTWRTLVGAANLPWRGEAHPLRANSGV